MIPSAAGWIGEQIAKLWNTLAPLLWDIAAWIGDAMYFAIYGVWAYLWGWCANWMFGIIGTALSLVNIQPGDAAYVMSILRSLNTWFPVDMIVTLLPGWMAFEMGLLVTRILVKGWR